MTSRPPAAGRLSFVVHVHLYQPPREDPWLGAMPSEPSAAPFHDWNERIHAECYRPLTEARLLDASGAVRDFINTLEWVSFDAAPTLLRWMEREEPATYAAFLEADRRSVKRLGRGNAIATSYHHAILPLSSPRDRRTEIRWGIADFESRFGRAPEGFWLPEAAVDYDTLRDLEAEGIAFTIVGSDQIDGPPPSTGRAGVVDLGGGRSIAVFAYDGAMAHDVSFGDLLRHADRWAEAVRHRARPDTEVVVSVATDGETFGHHHTFGEMGLASVIADLAGDPGVQVENYASALQQRGAEGEVRLRAPSAWSCAHGIGRWKEDCGCRAGGDDTSQAWRAPLRDGLTQLSEQLHRLFEQEAAQARIGDPWALRDRFGTVVGSRLDERVALVVAAAPGADPRRILELLEMERELLAAFTSCAWFFDDVAGLETLNVMRSAARALDLAGPAGQSAESALRAVLTTAKSNDRTRGNAGDLWDREVRPGVRAAWRAAAVAEFRRALGVDDASAHAGAFHVALSDDDHIEARDRRTGRLGRCVAELVGAPEGDGPAVRIASAREGGPTGSITVRVDDLPHPWARDIRALLRDRLLRRWALPAERAHWLTSGERGVDAAVEALSRLLYDGDLREVATLRDARELVAWIARATDPFPARAQAALAAARDRADERLDPLLAIAGVSPF